MQGRLSRQEVGSGRRGWPDCPPSRLPGGTGTGQMWTKDPKPGLTFGLEEAEVGHFRQRGPWDFLRVRTSSRWPHVPTGLLKCGSCD